jgi:hypothetical protein
VIADAISKCKGIDKRPLAGTQEFLNRGKLCRGVVCVSSNADGLFRVPGMWTKGKDVCDICAESEPETKPVERFVKFFSASKKAQPKPPPPPKPPLAPKPAKPDNAEVQALVAAEISRVLPVMVRDEVRALVRKVLANV